MLKAPKASAEDSGRYSMPALSFVIRTSSFRRHSSFELRHFLQRFLDPFNFAQGKTFARNDRMLWSDTISHGRARRRDFARSGATHEPTRAGEVTLPSPARAQSG